MTHPQPPAWGATTAVKVVAGAVGGACLFGGTPAIAEEAGKLNGEILFALKECRIETPTFINDVEAADKKGICLVQIK